MFLNAYYKLIAYNYMSKAYTYGLGQSDYLDIPQLITCNDTILNKTSFYTSNYGSYNNQTPFNAPYKGMKSQLTNWDSDTGSAPANIVIGSGTTPPVATDTKIENEIINNISYVVLTTTIDTTNGIITYDKIMKNNGSDTITINELGLTWAIGTESWSSHTGYQVLVYREVLDTPLIGEPGETFTVSITHQFTMPT